MPDADDADADEPTTLTADTVRVDRDETGAILPVWETTDIPGYGECEFQYRPPTAGDKNRWRRRLEEHGEDLPDSVEYDLLDEFIVTPGFEGDEWGEDCPAKVAEALALFVQTELFGVADDVYAQLLAEELNGTGDGAGN